MAGVAAVNLPWSPYEDNPPVTVAIVRDVLYLMEALDRDDEGDPELVAERYGTLGAVLEILRYRLAGVDANDPDTTIPWAAMFAQKKA